MVEAQPFGISPVVGATAGDLASLTSTGLLADSGVSSAVAHDPATLYVAANGDDSSAARGRSDLAFATLNAAAAAAVSGDTIRVGVGTFAPLTATLPAWVRIWGSGRPTVDSESAPTKLLNGTVIQGPLLLFNDGVEVHNLGVDSGSEVCTALYSGSAADALAISNVALNYTLAGSPTGGTFTLTAATLTATATTAALAYNASAATIQAALVALSTVGAGGATVTGSAGSWLIQLAVLANPYGLTVNTGSLTGGTLALTIGHPTGVARIKRPRVSGVVALGSGPTNQCHGMRIENVEGAIVDAVESWYATHCFAIKGSDCNVSNGLFSGGGNSHCYIKSDNYAPTSGVNVDNVVCRTAGSSGGSAWGIAIDAFSAAIANVNVSNAVIEAGIAMGLEFNAANGMSGVSLSNVADEATTPVVWTDLAQPYVTFSGVTDGGVPIYPTIFVGASGAPAFQDTWANYGSGYSGARFWKDAGGVVHLAGLVTASGSSIGAMFTLPAGYRPSSPVLIFSAGNFAGGAAASWIDVSSVGVVGSYGGNGGLYWLDGITFTTD